MSDTEPTCVMERADYLLPVSPPLGNVLELVHIVLVGGIVVPATAQFAMSVGFELGRVVHSSGGPSAGK